MYALHGHVTTIDNTVGRVSLIDLLELNDNPRATVIVSHILDPYAAPLSPAIIRSRRWPHLLGAIFDPSVGRWGVVTQDGSAIPPGLHIAIWVEDIMGSNALSWIHVARDTPGDQNIFGNATRIDHPSLDGHPEVILFISPLVSPIPYYGVTLPNIFIDHPVGVYYNRGTGKWMIFLADGSPMPTGAKFSVNFSACSDPDIALHYSSVVSDGIERLLPVGGSEDVVGSPFPLVWCTQNLSIYENSCSPYYIGPDPFTVSRIVWFDSIMGVLPLGNPTRPVLIDEYGAPIPRGVAFNIHAPM